MTRKLVLTIGWVALTLCVALPALADDDDCAEPMANWQPREQVAKMASDHGWTVRRIKIDEGCYRLDARDETGRRIEVWVNPATLDILEIEHEHD
jgi:hypothetical protein